MLENTGARRLQVFPVILDPDGAIHLLEASSQDGQSYLFLAHRSATMMYQLTSDPGARAIRDDLYLVVVEEGATDKSPALGQSFAQAGIACEPGEATCTRDNNRGGEPTNPAGQALLAVLDGNRSAGAPIPKTGIRRFSWKTVRP